MSNNKRIFVVGHPGAGKGVLAKALAEQLGWQFVDADLGLESHIGRTLSEIIGAHDHAFHDCLAKITASLKTKENIVVATDAGIIDDEKNKELLSSEFVVYLQVSVAVQLQRTARNNQTPLLLHTDMEAFFDKLHKMRDGVYEKSASIVINSDDSKLAEHVQKVAAHFSENPETSAKKLNLENKDVVIFHKETHKPVHLTEQQAMCVKLMSQGKTAKDIAREIDISYRTVEGHIAKAMELSGCSSSKELIALYHGI